MPSGTVQGPGRDPMCDARSQWGPVVCAASMQWFQQLLAKFTFKNKFPPSKLRHIFVDERCSADYVEGPSNKAAARLMGNSVGGLLLSSGWHLHKANRVPLGSASGPAGSASGPAGSPHMLTVVCPVCPAIYPVFRALGHFL
jgi:hypothetical protein